MPFSLPFPFSITRFNFFCLQVLLTRASLLALAKSIYYTIYYSEQLLLYSGERALTLISFKNIQMKQNLMPSAFSQPIYLNLPSNFTDIFSTGENKGFHFSFCKGNLKNCKLKVSFLIRRIIIHVSSLLIFEKQTSTLFVHLLLFFSK